MGLLDSTRYPCRACLIPAPDCHPALPASPHRCCSSPSKTMPMPMPMTPDSPSWLGVAGNGGVCHTREALESPHPTYSVLAYLDYNSSLPLRTLLVCLVWSAHHSSVFNQTRSVILHILRDRVLLLFTIPTSILPICESPRAPDALRPFPYLLAVAVAICVS